MARLDNQRSTLRPHVRKNKRKYARGYTTCPHEVWGDTGRNPINVTPGAATNTTTSISPTSIARNTTVTITLTGTGYTTASQIIYRDTDGYTWIPVATTFVSATSITGSFNIPEAGSYEVAAQKPVEAMSAAKALTVT